MKISDRIRTTKSVTKSPLKPTNHSTESSYSFIIPAYKSAQFIEECLDSIYGQSLFKRSPSLLQEVLIGVDSCEDTLNKLISVSSKYPKLKVYFFKERRGPYIVRNTLISKAEADFLFFFDSDDYMKPGLLDVVDRAMKGGYDICKIKYMNVKKGSPPVAKPKVSDGVGCHKRRVHEVLGGYEEWLCGADSDFCFRSERHFKIHHVNTPMFYRRIHGNSLTQHPETNPQSEKRREIAKTIDRRNETGYYKTVRPVEIRPVECQLILGEEDTDDNTSPQVEQEETSRTLDDFNSTSYWISRYETGGHSGQGSRGKLAYYKASVVNEIIKKYHIDKMIEFGSGDGYQCSLFNVESYIGFDVSEKMVQYCNNKYKHRGWNFHTLQPTELLNNVSSSLTLSLDVIFHLIEDEVFDTYMQNLLNCSEKFVLIYSSDRDPEPGEKLSPHVKHRKYSDWIQKNAPDFTLVSRWTNPYRYSPGKDQSSTSFSEFKLFQKVNKK